MLWRHPIDLGAWLAKFDGAAAGERKEEERHGVTSGLVLILPRQRDLLCTDTMTKALKRGLNLPANIRMLLDAIG